ncbi:ribosomal protein L11 methyltransferase [Variibacter gotjawalensis]|uniref:Ribosomal protein L11 methyltransferase n=1 Tax=Variibacter gotjawalensis TaxID=1333996 RepID=A0A0S3PTP0_9BRAD|nr:50S ribosomal protein L11 methyltransferase [Variibacter gotjawalensis]NIK49646.1 ribosomal protein L11 methyltransferase [Variibacter gotjawalensis]RZS45658.1 [LSU ribosomal protein L11P]-lysine N-methyltransferase [Variibacter gotjawalensis]BAT59329.1 ribosomal protein L11 methyltransferase [Variibacter gotjawalensis]
METSSFVARLRPRSDPQEIAGRLTELLDADECVLSVFEEKPGVWAIELHFSEAPDEAVLRDIIAAATDDELASTLSVEKIEARDWVAASLAGLSAVPAGRFVVQGSHLRGTESPSRIAIEIEAALAFGTGHHGTTRGCLLVLDELIKRKHPRRILDVGTGTAVLAIAAARALHRPVLASDIDRTSVKVAQANAHANRADQYIRFVHAAGVDAGVFRRNAPFDLVFANILLRPLQRLSAPIARLVPPGGHVILSGLTNDQKTAALAFYRAQGLVLIKTVRLEGWTTLLLTRPRHSRPAVARRSRAI